MRVREPSAGELEPAPNMSVLWAERLKLRRFTFEGKAGEFELAGCTLRVWVPSISQTGLASFGGLLV